MAMQLGGGRDHAPMSEINVTPLVDVMLVLLIIFMLTAPHLEQGVKVDLPEVTVTPFPAQTDEMVITVTGGQEVFMDSTKVPLEKLEATLRQAVTARPGKDVYMKADKDVPYGFVVQVMAAARKAGVPGLGMVTEPEKIKSP